MKVEPTFFLLLMLTLMGIKTRPESLRCQGSRHCWRLIFGVETAPICQVVQQPANRAIYRVQYTKIKYLFYLWRFKHSGKDTILQRHYVTDCVANKRSVICQLVSKTALLSLAVATIWIQFLSFVYCVGVKHTTLCNYLCSSPSSCFSASRVRNIGPSRILDFGPCHNVKSNLLLHNFLMPSENGFRHFKERLKRQARVVLWQCKNNKNFQFYRY